jgi:hypothetical protein
MLVLDVGLLFQFSFDNGYVKHVRLACLSRNALASMLVVGLATNLHIRTVESVCITTGIRGFAECLLSGTRQKRLCREPHSKKFGSR